MAACVDFKLAHFVWSTLAQVLFDEFAAYIKHHEIDKNTGLGRVLAADEPASGAAPPPEKLFGKSIAASHYKAPEKAPPAGADGKGSRSASRPRPSARGASEKSEAEALKVCPLAFLSPHSQLMPCSNSHAKILCFPFLFVFKCMN